MTPTPATVLAVGHRRVTVGVVAVVSLVAFEAFAVITALPTALAELDALWAYGPAFGVHLSASLFACVVAGAILDRWGPLGPFVGGAVFFALGSLLVSIAPTAAALLAGRAAQGLGAGLMVVVLYVVVARRYPEAARPRAFAVMASAWVMPSVAGPPLAALVTEHVGWRWVFAGVPILLAPAAVTLVPEVRACADKPGAVDSRAGGEPGSDGPGSGVGGRPQVGRLPRLIWLAAGAAAGGTLLQYAMQGHSLVLVATFGAAAIALLVLTLPRLLPAGTFQARPGAPVFVLLRGLLAGAFFGTEILLPLMIVTQRGASAMFGSLVLAAGSVGWAAGAWIQGRWSSRHRIHGLLSGCCLLLAGGIVVAALGLADRLPPGSAGLGWLLAGIGMGAGLTVVNRHAVDSASYDRQGQVSSSLQVSDLLASTVTTGACAAIVAGTPEGRTHRFLIAFLLMAGVALAATVVARVRTRVLPTHDGGPARAA